MADENKIIFWAYDLFPFVLSGKTEGPPVPVNTDEGAGIAYRVTSYSGQFTARHIEDLGPGSAITQKLMELRVEHAEAIQKLNEEFRRKALQAAPFLSKFPAYKNK